MSNSANQLGGKCPYMPYLGRGQMSGGEHVLHSFLEVRKDETEKWKKRVV